MAPSCSTKAQGVQAYAQAGKTMGIPLLYPWANRLGHRGYEAAGRRVALPDPDGRYPIDPGGLPIHGALPGDLIWEVADQPETDRVRARLTWNGPALLELFPFEHELELEAVVSDGALSITTTVVASGPEPGSGVVRVSSLPEACRPATGQAGTWSSGRRSASNSTIG